ncbi:glycerol uptake facilitator protein [Psychromonas ingrahamii 37]|uniref:Glycerol uptake facilitator protein n=1 Tax=Psychromonas ingrahamii (strain DSM 17664 / CCUG 51855 / 37) TaxID=357804 RepID=A1SZD9_PSYIN|nr:aquaporin [Psychromonas ingrahamii]ABM04854.1 glycerol uptake facilitator protein [Psychromonas ingrahamii 37]
MHRELIGTGLLIFFVVGCIATLVLTGVSFGQWKISIMLDMSGAICCTAGIFGAHINPAATITLAAFLGFEKEKSYLYIAAQLAATFCSAALIYAFSNLFTDDEIAHGFLHNSEAALSTAGIFSTYPLPSFFILGTFSIKFFITAVIIFAILALNNQSNGAPQGVMPSFNRSCSCSYRPFFRPANGFCDKSGE